jgi:hypothetical protein
MDATPGAMSVPDQNMPFQCPRQERPSMLIPAIPRKVLEILPLAFLAAASFADATTCGFIMLNSLTLRNFEL